MRRRFVFPSFFILYVVYGSSESSVAEDLVDGLADVPETRFQIESFIHEQKVPILRQFRFSGAEAAQ